MVDWTYEREVCYFKKAYTDCTKKAISSFPWEGSSADLDKNNKV